MKVNLEELDKRIEQKLITKRPHPSLALWIYNYTPVCQYNAGNWDSYTIMSRGLILDENGTIVARAFDKFWNYEEHQNNELPTLPLHERYRVLEKMDGSLFIVTNYKEQLITATRGSFTSEQAILGTKILNQRYANFLFAPNRTYLFELIAPSNRIVVDYGTMEDIVLLAIIDNETGKNVAELSDYPFPVVQTYPSTSIDELLASERLNAEGFVLQFMPSDTRVKIKHKDYLRLHRLLTQVSTTSIWELMRNGQSFDELLENIPDELYSWVRNIQAQLNAEYNSIARVNREIANAIVALGYDSRRQMAEIVLAKAPHPAVVFNMLDNKDYNQIIWKLIKPKYQQAFREDINT